MSRNLELPDPLFDALENAAAADGLSPVGWIAAHLPQAPAVAHSNGAKTLADLFAGRTGRISSDGSEALSENCGERFAEHVEEKRMKGQL